MVCFFPLASHICLLKCFFSSARIQYLMLGAASQRSGCLLIPLNRGQRRHLSSSLLKSYLVSSHPHSPLTTLDGITGPCQTGILQDYIDSLRTLTHRICISTFPIPMGFDETLRKARRGASDPLPITVHSLHICSFLLM